MSFWAIFCAFRSLTTRKIKILEKRKNNLEMSSFYTYQNSWSYDVCSLKYGVWQTFCHFGPFFALYPTIDPNKKNLEKCKKTFSLCITQVYYEWRSYHIWFLRYKAQQRDFFVILGHFLPFDAPNNSRNQTFENNEEKKKKKKMINLEILSFDTCVPQMIWCMVPGIWSTTDRIFLILDHFCPFTLQTNQKIKS